MNKTALLKHLAADELSDASREAVLNAGTAATPALLQVLQDSKEWGEDEDADGSAALHAAALLGDLKAPAAIEPMLEMLMELEPFGALAQSIVEALGHMGAAALEPTLKHLAALDADADSGTDGFDYLNVLSRCGVQDARIYTLLCEAFKRAPGDTAALLGQYGDAAALPLLSKKLDAARTTNAQADLDPALDITEMAHAIVALGGELTAAQKQKLETAAQIVLDATQAAEAEAALEDSATQLMAEAIQAPASMHHAPHVHGPHCTHDHEPQEPRVRAREKLGRNDPCWCESGKKYKKCHYDNDQRSLY